MSQATNMFMHPGQGKPVKNGETPAVSTGRGGIPASLKVKAAGSKPAPGIEKTVNNL